MSAEDYPVNFPVSQTYTYAARRLNGLTLSGQDGTQNVTVAQREQMYNRQFESVVSAKAGEKVTVTASYTTDWMNAYVYVDCNRNGQFEENELLSYSYLNGKNSAGEAIPNGNSMKLPAFDLPKGLAEGVYAIRLKIDWNNADPGGSNEENEHIIDNGGAILDCGLLIHGDKTTVELGETENGNVMVNPDVDFGSAVPLIVQPYSGYALNDVTVRYGANVLGEPYVHSVPQYQTTTLPAFVLKDNTLTPDMFGPSAEILMTANFKAVVPIPAGEGDYPLGFEIGDLPPAHPKVSKIGGNHGTIGMELTNKNYQSLLPQSLGIAPGDTLQFSISATTYGNPTPVKVQIDFSQNGLFDLESEQVFDGLNPCNGTRENNMLIPIDKRLPKAFYRMRITVQEKVIDCLLNVRDKQEDITVNALHGNVYADANGTPLANKVTVDERAYLYFQPISTGWTSDSVTFRHGHNLDGEQYIHGNRQWDDFRKALSSNGKVIVEWDCVDAELRVNCEWKRTGDKAWVCIFNDEFNGSGEPTSEKWVRTPRAKSTWNRFCSDSPLVVYEEGGNLVCRTIPNPDRSLDDVDMLSGGIQSKGLFGFKYGHAEARIKTTKHVGNFPAFWMMPVDNSAGWPYAGEIDIWETIDSQNTSYHTVHSGWTYVLKHTNDPQSSFSVNNVDMDLWHTYAVDWNEEEISWSVDGRNVGSYKKSTDDNVLAQGQWPYDHPFYLILNQSVGNNAWAKNADTSFTYVTLFDWVRVYQPAELTGIEEVKNDGPKAKGWYDLQGRQIQQPSGHGIYIQNGKKFIIQ